MALRNCLYLEIVKLVMVAYYLLDSEKRVMLKDCNLVPQIEEAIYYAEQSKQ